MKKFLSLLLAVLMLFLLAACGDEGGTEATQNGENDPTVDAQDVVDKVLEDAEEHESFSKGAVDYFLRKTVGFDLSAVEPDFQWKLESNYSAYGDDPSTGSGHAVINFTKAEGEITDEEYDKWFKKLFDTTAKASDDGYNIKGYEFADAEKALNETTLEDSLKGFLQGWAFRVDGKIYVVYVSREYDNSKDSELGKLFYYDGAKVDIGVGLQKSLSSTLDEAESYLSENEDEVKEAISDFFN